MKEEDDKKIAKELAHESAEKSIEAEKLVETPEIQDDLVESKETASKEEIQQLRHVIQSSKLDENAKTNTTTDANNIKLLDDEKKINKLLDLAKSKGLTYAFDVAQKMNDPYVLDTLHDKLAKDGYYKSFK